jgi:Na+-driven multidrug efflux pump
VVGRVEEVVWQIVGPAILQRIALYGINVVSQAFIGHIGDLELAAFSIAAIRLQLRLLGTSVIVLGSILCRQLLPTKIYREKQFWFYARAK